MCTQTPFATHFDFKELCGALRVSRVILKSIGLRVVEPVTVSVH